jgi:hypothetical protein
MEPNEAILITGAERFSNYEVHVVVTSQTVASFLNYQRVMVAHISLEEIMLIKPLGIFLFVFDSFTDLLLEMNTIELRL